MVSLVAAGTAPASALAAANGATLSGSLRSFGAAWPTGSPPIFAWAGPAAASVIVAAASAVAAMRLRGDLMLVLMSRRMTNRVRKATGTSATVRSGRGGIPNRHATSGRDFARPARCATSVLIAYGLAVHPP